MTNVLDCDILVSEFELQSRYYIYFRATTLGKDMNPLTTTSNKLNSIIAILQI